METGRALFIEWLKEIGAEQITDLGDDETISFEHNGKKIQLFGVWFNDRTAGVGINVEDTSAGKQSRGELFEP